MVNLRPLFVTMSFSMVIVLDKLLKEDCGMERMEWHDDRVILLRLMVDVFNVSDSKVLSTLFTGSLSKAPSARIALPSIAGSTTLCFTRLLDLCFVIVNLPADVTSSAEEGNSRESRRKDFRFRLGLFLPDFSGDKDAFDSAFERKDSLLSFFALFFASPSFCSLIKSVPSSIEFDLSVFTSEKAFKKDSCLVNSLDVSSFIVPDMEWA